MSFTPHFTITNRITAGLTRIERARGFLEAATLSEAWIQEMGRKAFILEAHHTTHIEGSQLTLVQAGQLLDGNTLTDADPDDIQELLNYKEAFDFVSQYLESSGPITESLIKEIHKRLVQGVRGEAASPGEYRHVQNYIVNSHTKKTVYTPPPALEVPPMMADLVYWINAEQEVHPVLKSGISQFQLVHIHPFLDGNGRTSRLLSTLLLYKNGYDFKRLFTISEYYDRDRSAFYKALQSVREHEMDMTAWLEYFIEGLMTQLGEVRARGEQVIRRDVLAKEYHLTERQEAVLGYLQTHASLTIQDFEEICPGIARRSLQRDLKIMVDKGLFACEGKTNSRVYRLLETR